MQGFPGGSVVKESACNTGDPGSIPGLGRSSGGGHGNPLQYSCLENPHGQRSLADHSSWGHKESDTNERLHITLIKPSIYRELTVLDMVLRLSLSLPNTGIEPRSPTL